MNAYSGMEISNFRTFQLELETEGKTGPTRAEKDNTAELFHKNNFSPFCSLLFCAPLKYYSLKVDYNLLVFKCNPRSDIFVFLYDITFA